MSGSIGTKRQDARAVRSREAMRAALLRLLEQAPLEAITGAMVAEAAAVGYSTFFRHYADVRALLADAVAAMTDTLAADMMPALLAGDGDRAARALVDAVTARRGAMGALLTGAGDALRHELSRRVIERIAALPDMSPAWLPHRLAIRVAVATTIELLDWWLCEEPERDAAEVAALLRDLVLAPLTVPPGQ